MKLLLYNDSEIFYIDSFVASTDYLKGMIVIDLEMGKATKDGVWWSHINFAIL